MKKLKCLFVTMLTMVCCYFTAVNAYADIIRVGLEKNFKNVSSITINDSNMGVGIEDGTKYNISGTYEIKPISGTYYNINEYFDTYKEANSKLTSFTGFSCIPVLTERGWTIYIRTDDGKLTYNTINTGQYCVGFAVDGSYKFLVDGLNPARVNATDGVIGVGSNSYRGDIEIYRQDSVITAVNVINEEEYLYGVINSEMPSSWSIEAQKAQAVAARTYVERAKNRHTIYDVCDSTHCQDYNGTKNETEAGITAVDETEGLCVYYNDSLIEAVYFSSDGGATFDGSEAWGSETPYLKGKIDNYETECREWTREFTYSELTNMCEAKGYNIGNVITVEADYNDRGLVTSLTFFGSKGSKTIINDEVRTAFSAATGGSLLSRNFSITGGAKTSTIGDSVFVMSAAGVIKEASSSALAQNNNGQQGILGDSFVVESTNGSKKIEPKTTITEGTAGKITFNGKGYGHNVGMSQYGAKAMAESGYSFTNILKFYYTGVEIK